VHLTRVDHDAMTVRRWLVATFTPVKVRIEENHVVYRAFYALGIGYVLLCSSLVVWRSVDRRPPGSATRNLSDHSSSGLPHTPGAVWFERVRASCNAVEVESRLARDPYPDDRDGVAYGAACLALAGKMDRSRNLIRQLAAADRSPAASVMFEVGHLVADAGDEKSAAPLLELVLDYQPDNEMALYHLGLAEQATYKFDSARRHLQRFVDLHPQRDSLRENADRSLAFLEHM